MVEPCRYGALATLGERRGVEITRIVTAWVYEGAARCGTLSAKYGFSHYTTRVTKMGKGGGCIHHPSSAPHSHCNSLSTIKPAPMHINIRFTPQTPRPRAASAALTAPAAATALGLGLGAARAAREGIGRPAGAARRRLSAALSGPGQAIFAALLI